MDETVPSPRFDDEPAGTPPAGWPQAVMHPSAQLLDCEEWFSRERDHRRALGDGLGGDLP